MPEPTLIVGPAWVGDMILAQSLFMLLRARTPESALDVLAPGWSVPLLARMPEVRRAIPLPLGHGEFGFGLRHSLGRSLRVAGYGRAIVLPRSFKSALVPFFARARQRTGFLGEWRYGLLNDIRPLDKAALPRTVDRFLALGLPRGAALPAAPRPHLVAQPAGELRARLGLDADRPVLALCPGAEYGPAKRWPVEHFAALARDYLAHGWQVWLIGSAKDAQDCAMIQTQCQGACANLAGRSTLVEAVDLLACADAVVSNDSGLMHIAAALDRPLAALYGSSDPRHTPPMSARAAILSLGLECSPCFQRECPLGHLHCLRELAPARVGAALDAVREAQP
jgi:heptosyltransferase-2